MSDNYWKELRNRPLPRRAVLGAGMAAGAGLLGAGLVGCGDDDTPATTGPAGTTTAASSTSASSATATPKKGGTWKIGTSTAVTGLDPYSNAIPTVALATHVFSRLFTVPSTRADSKSGAVPLNVVPDAAESMTASADLKTYTVKLRANAKWHPPISRPLDADDVVFSWKRFTGRITGTPPSPNKGLLDVIDDVSATDTKTVVFKLNKAYGPFDSLLADYALLLMPKETGTSYDPQKVMIGTGPWMFKEYTPGSSLKLVRNPEWHFGPDRPYLDGYEAYIVPDRTNQLIQFKAGQIDSYIPSGVDIADVVANVKRVQMFPRAQTNGLVGFFAFSSVTDPANKARWTDVRVRKAMSMALDRDSMMTAAYGLDSFKTAGFDLKSPWQGILPLSYGPITVQVQQEANVVPSFKYDAKAAKGLLDQTGGGFTVDLIHTVAYGPEYLILTQLAAKFWDDIGIKVNQKALDYRSDFIPNIYQGKEFFGERGISHAGQAGLSEPGVFIQSIFAEGAQINQGRINDPNVGPALEQYFAEREAGKRITILRDLQFKLLEKLYYIPSGWGSQPDVTAFQANARGVEEYRSFGYAASGQDPTYYWKA